MATKRRHNPYTPGAATVPPVLTGRDELLARFDEYLDARQAGYPAESLVISGQRGMGKTVLLGAFRDMARERDWLAQRVEATDQGPFLVALASEVTELLEGDGRGGMLRRARQALDELTVALGVGPAKVEVRARAKPGLALDVPVTRLITSLGEAAKQRGAGAAVLLDEIQAVDAPSLRAVARALQAAEGDRLPVLLAAGGLPSAPDRLRQAVSYAERYRYVTLGPLGVTAVRVALEEPARRLGVSYDPAAVERLVEASEGYPYLVQLLGRNAWQAADGAERITIEHADTALAGALDDLASSVLRSRWLRSSNKERVYLAAMASLGPGPVPSGDIARAMAQTAQQVSYLRQSLIDRGLIIASGTRAVDFSLPHFGTFVLDETGATGRRALDAPAPDPPRARPPP